MSSPEPLLQQLGVKLLEKTQQGKLPWIQLEPGSYRINFSGFTVDTAVDRPVTLTWPDGMVLQVPCPAGSLQDAIQQFIATVQEYEIEAVLKTLKEL